MLMILWFFKFMYLFIYLHLWLEVKSLLTICMWSVFLHFYVFVLRTWFWFSKWYLPFWVQLTLWNFPFIVIQFEIFKRNPQKWVIYSNLNSKDKFGYIVMICSIKILLKKKITKGLCIIFEFSSFFLHEYVVIPFFQKQK